jgi:nickel/cobalt exporter
MPPNQRRAWLLGSPTEPATAVVLASPETYFGIAGPTRISSSNTCAMSERSCTKRAVARALLRGGGRRPWTRTPRPGTTTGMREGLFYILSSFWAGAVHAATPGHGKTIAAAYIVGARGRPIDALILGIFVTLSHVSGIVVVGVLASLGSAWLMPQRVEAWLALAMGLLVAGLGAWMLWMQRDLLALAMGESAPEQPRGLAHSHALEPALVGDPEHRYAHDHVHRHHHHEDGPAHDHRHTHDHDHAHHQAEDIGWHSHGWGTYHSHRLDLVTDARPKLAVLLALGIAGGILPDPAALAILLAALSSGQVMLGLATVVVFSLGFAATLVVVGVIAAQVGQKVLRWLSSIWVVRVQIATTLLILGMGVVLTARGASQLAALPS